MSYIVREFNKPESMIFHSFLETGAAAKVCQMRPKHQKCTGFDSDVACVEKTMESLGNTFASPNLDKDFDIV